MEEPFRLSVDEIAKLTDAQIVGLYGRPRDEKGVPKRTEVDGQRKYKTRNELKKEFMDGMRAFGMDDEKAEMAWEKMVTKGV
jgi:hypothetical protein